MKRSINFQSSPNQPGKQLRKILRGSERLKEFVDQGAPRLVVQLEIALLRRAMNQVQSFSDN